MGSYLRQLRKKKGYTQAFIAERTGFTQRMISDIEQGKPGISIKRYIDYAHLLGIDFYLESR